MSPDGRHLELAFTGPATFFKAPYVPVTDLQRAAGRFHAGVLGVPFDFAVGFRPGARFAPAAVRAASGRYALPPAGYYDFETDSYGLEGARLVDAGDVDVAQLETQESHERITAAARALRSAVALPLFVGGDHSVSYPLLRAFDDVPRLHVVQLDAHLDYSGSRNATRLANSSPFRRAVEALPELVKITVVGLRGVRADAEAFRAARERGHELIGARAVHDALDKVIQRLPEGENVYLSVDVDAIDASEMPGTGSPEPEGLTYAQARDLVVAAVRRNHVVGVDLMELAPNLDPTGRSALLSARLLAETLVAWWAARPGSGG